MRLATTVWPMLTRRSMIDASNRRFDGRVAEVGFRQIACGATLFHFRLSDRQIGLGDLVIGHGHVVIGFRNGNDGDLREWFACLLDISQLLSSPQFGSRLLCFRFQLAQIGDRAIQGGFRLLVLGFIPSGVEVRQFRADTDDRVVVNARAFVPASRTILLRNGDRLVTIQR